MHPNLLLYKYYWWVFHVGCPREGWDFLSNQYRLCTHDAFKLISQLRAEEKPYRLYNMKLYRHDPNNAPWDYAALRRRVEELAPAFPDDADPVWNGHK